MGSDDNEALGQLFGDRVPAAGTLQGRRSSGRRDKELSLGFLPILILLFVIMWFLVIRPQRKRQAEQKRIMDNLSPGQEVLTAGGLYGTVQSVLDEDEARIEIAPDVYVRVARRAIAAVITDDDDELTELERAQEEAREEVLAAREGDR
jgi:preprotein translocase subunit YajC